MKKGIVQIWGIAILMLAIAGAIVYSEVNKNVSPMQAPTGNLQAVPLEVVPTGFSLLSISNVHYISNDPELNGDAIEFTAAMTQTGDKAIISLQKPLSDGLLGAYIFGNNADLEIDLLNQSLQYNIDYYGEIIYGGSMRNTIITQSCVDQGVNTCTQSHRYNNYNPYQIGICGNNDPITNLYSYYAQNYCYSFTPLPLFQKGTLSGFPFAKYKVQAKLTQGTTSLSGVIDELTPSINLDNVCIFTWQFNALGNQLPGRPENVVLLRDLGLTDWKESQDIPFYQNYINAYNTYSAIPNNNVKEKNFALAFANAQQAILRNDLKNSFTNAYNYYPPYQVIIPVIKGRCKASYFAMEVPVGQPKIVSIGSDAILENTQTYYQVQIKNVGSVPDTFTTKLECPNPVTFSANSITLSPNIQGVVKLVVEGMASSQTCKITASSINNPAKADLVYALLNIYKNQCPANFQCCMGSPAYYDRACPNKTVFIESGSSMIGTIKQTRGYYYVQHYDCGNFICSASTLSDQSAEQIYCSYQDAPVQCPASTITPTYTYTPTPTVLTPTPTYTYTSTPTIQVTGTPTPTDIFIQPTPSPQSTAGDNNLIVFIGLGVLVVIIIFFLI